MVKLLKKIRNHIISNVLEYPANQKRKIFYSQFIGKNEIVFDIGANNGNRTTIFSKLCNKVIAVEPNPELVKLLNKKFGTKIILVPKAIGAETGETDLFINKSNVLSTISQEWITKVQETKRFGEYSNSFSKKIKVNVVTINDLIVDYGLPSFAKIDVEGVEYEIVKTIKNCSIRGISCEFSIPESIKNTLSIITHLNEVGYNSYNISFGETMELLTSENLTYDKMTKLINALPSTSWGDIYAFSEKK